ncbi:MAG TPA: thiamine-binding protein [Actinomycetota bacterium]|nr:thiamine-binding protein [Actinomycetota bacterium]
MAEAEFSIYPFVEGVFPEYVKGALEEAESSGLTVRIGPLGTSVEGSLEAVLDLVCRIQELAFRHGAKKVITSIGVDEQ